MAVMNETAGYLKISVLLLAAGESRRMGGANKLLLKVPDGSRHAGLPIIRRTAAALLGCDSSDRVVVTGRDAEDVEKALDGCGFRAIHNPQHKSGMLSSLQVGLRALQAADGVLVCLGDQPFLLAWVIDELVRSFRQTPTPASGLFRACFGEEPGHPVLIGQSHVPTILRRNTHPDEGARFLFRDHPELVRDVRLPVRWRSVDLDTPKDFTRAAAESCQ